MPELFAVEWLPEFNYNSPELFAVEWLPDFNYNSSESVCSRTTATKLFAEESLPEIDCSKTTTRKCLQKSDCQYLFTACLNLLQQNDCQKQFAVKSQSEMITTKWLPEDDYNGLQHNDWLLPIDYSEEHNDWLPPRRTSWLTTTNWLLKRA